MQALIEVRQDVARASCREDNIYTSLKQLEMPWTKSRERVPSFGWRELERLRFSEFRLQKRRNSPEHRSPVDIRTEDDAYGTCTTLPLQRRTVVLVAVRRGSPVLPPRQGQTTLDLGEQHDRPKAATKLWT